MGRKLRPLYGGDVITKSTESEGISFKSVLQFPSKRITSELDSYLSDIDIWRFAKSKVSFSMLMMYLLNLTSKYFVINSICSHSLPVCIRTVLSLIPVGWSVFLFCYISERVLIEFNSETG